MPSFPSQFTPGPIPTFAFQVSLGVGPAPLSPAGLKCLLVGSKTTSGTGTATDLVPTEVFGTDDAETKFGARSRLAAMARVFRAIAPRGQLFACPVAPPAGGVAATAVLAFTGPATAAGVVRLRIAGRLIREVVIPSGTTAAAAAALVEAVLDEVSELPCTAAVGSGGSTHILTLTAATVGEAGNQLRVVFESTATGLTIALNGGATAASGKAYFGSGSGVATSGRSTASGTFPVRLVNGDTIVVSIDAGSNETATFSGFARRLTGAAGTLAAVTASNELVLAVNGVTRTVAFAGTENTDALFAAAINAIPGVFADVTGGQVRITTDRQGTGASLVVDATTDADVLASLGLSSGQVGASLGSSNVADIEAVTAAEFTSLVEAAAAGCTAGADADGHPYIASDATGTGASVQVQASSTADDEFGFDNAAHPGAAGTPAVAGVGVIDTGTAGATPTLLWAAISGTRYDRIALDADDDTARAAFKLHLTTQSGIGTGQRCMGVVASLRDTLSDVQADAVAMNEPRATLLYCRRSHRTTGELAAAYCAAKIYGNGGLVGENTYRAAKANGLPLYPAIEATDEEERLSGTQVATLLRAGVTVLGADRARAGYACVVRPVTTRTKNASGGTSYLVAAPSKVAVADVVADFCEAFAADNYADKNLVPNPASIEVAPSSPFVIWPDAIREDMLGILYQMENDALLVDVAAHADQVTVETTTVEGVTYAIVRVPFAVIPHLDSVIGDAQQVG